MREPGRGKPGNVPVFKIFPQNLLQNCLLLFNVIRVMEQRLLELSKPTSLFRNSSALIFDGENSSTDQTATTDISEQLGTWT